MYDDDAFSYVLQDGEGGEGHVLIVRVSVIISLTSLIPGTRRGIRGQGGGEGGDTHRLTFPLVSPPPQGFFRPPNRRIWEKNSF